MARLRYLKTLEQVKRAREATPEFLSSKVRSLRAWYETDPALAHAVLPRPLEPAPHPRIGVVVSQVSMQVSPELSVEIGAAVFGVAAVCDQVEGIYPLTMPMTAEAAVVGGRETYGEPKKLAEIELRREGEQVSASVARMGTTYLELRGVVGPALGPRQLTEFAYCFKALPSCEPDRILDADPLLVRLRWKHSHEKVERVEGEVVLRESPFDPVADLPVRRLLSMEMDEGTSESSAEVLRSVPGDWLLPFLHQRYDEPSFPGVEVG